MIFDPNSFRKVVLVFIFINTVTTTEHDAKNEIEQTENTEDSVDMNGHTIVDYYSEMFETGERTSGLAPADHRLNRKDQKRKRKEKRRERHKMRKERRKNRTSKHHHFMENIEDETDDEIDWLHGNVSSIWAIINRLQSDISELQDYNYQQQDKRRRGHHKIEHTKNIHKGVVANHHKKNQFQKERNDCPEGWSHDPIQCMDEDGGQRICSGKGECICGQCDCFPPNYGHRCLCRDDICDKYNGQLCGGTSRGQCRCNECICRPNYTGSVCECSLETNECTSPEVIRTSRKEDWNMNLCSRHGTCSCNVCQCDDGYNGKYCEDSIFSAGICERLKSCVLCEAFGVELLACKNCNIKINTVKSLELITTRCVMVHKGCVFQYGYKTPKDIYEVYVPEDNKC